MLVENVFPNLAHIVVHFVVIKEGKIAQNIQSSVNLHRGIELDHHPVPVRFY